MPQPIEQIGAGRIKVRAVYDIQTDSYDLAIVMVDDHGQTTHIGELLMHPITEPGHLGPTIHLAGGAPAIDFALEMHKALEALGLTADAIKSAPAIPME